MNPISTAVSGLNASSLRQANSANNIANLHSTTRSENGRKVEEPYVPVDTVQTSLEPEGGARASTRPRDPASVPVYQPEHPQADAEGVVQYPNVKLEEEVVQQQISTYDFKANLKSLKAADQMMQSLLDIKA